MSGRSTMVVGVTVSTLKGSYCAVTFTFSVAVAIPS